MPAPALDLAYADTSFLMAYYGNDSFTEQACATVHTNRLRIVACDINRFEFANALRLAQFRRIVGAGFVGRALAGFEADLRGGALRDTVLAWPQIMSTAHRLSETHTALSGNRGMDILHIAACLTASAATFYSFDDRQRSLAEHEGLTLNVIAARN